MIEVTVKLKIKGVEIELTKKEVQQLYEVLTDLIGSPKPFPLPSGPIYRDGIKPYEFPYYPVTSNTSEVGL